MVVCPYCGAEITFLLFYRRDCIRFVFDGKNYEEDEQSIGYDIDYACPNCDQTIAYSEDEAIRFLKGNNKE